MLRTLRVKNLGCFAEDGCSVEFAQETLLAGPNNSGKSMFIACINLLRNSLIAGSQSWSNDFYNLVGFHEAVHGHEIDRNIEISMTVFRDSKEFSFHLRIGARAPFYITVDEAGKLRSPSSQDVDFIRSIWYLRPNRSSVPYSAIVQPTSGVLQPLNPDGSNVINFLLERWTDRDKNWDVVEKWLKKIDADMTEMKTPIRGNNVYFETAFGNVPVNVSLQGSGLQNASAIIATVVFAPDDSTIVIEEPEAFLHPSSQEVIVDILNDAVVNHNKQVIFSTHSCNILLPFYNDVGSDGARRGQEHVRADPERFNMWAFKKASGKASVEQYPIQKKTFRQFREDFKHIWG
jgi:predicted ATPase